MLKLFKTRLREFTEIFLQQGFFKLKVKNPRVCLSVVFPLKSFHQSGFLSNWIYSTVVVIQRWCWISLPSNIQVSVPVFPNQRQWCNKPPRHQRTACSGRGKKTQPLFTGALFGVKRGCVPNHIPPLTSLFPAIPKTDVCLQLYSVI